MIRSEVLIYRIKSWVLHQLTAWHTGGEGVHSPYLFEWVRMVMSDENSYYIWKEIEAVREEMLRDDRVLSFVDYGSGKGSLSERRVRDIANGSLARKKYAQMLYRLVNWLGASRGLEDGSRVVDVLGFRGLKILELGTSLGVTTAYLAAADSRNRVVSCEGCSAVAEVAQENWDKLGLKNVECQVGELTVERLQELVGSLHGKVDVAFVDANHTYVSTRAYFNVLAENVHEKSVIVVDDIHHSEEMERAWKEICLDARVTSTMDLYQMGLVFFDPHYLRKNYRMRL